MVSTQKHFNCFAEQCDRFLTQAETGEPYDVDNMPQEPFAYAFLAGCVPGNRICDCTDHGIDQTFQADFRCEADHSRRIYEKGSLNLTVKQDRFINKVVTSRPIPKMIMIHTVEAAEAARMSAHPVKYTEVTAENSKSEYTCKV